MSTYYRKPEDKAFRVVRLNNEKTPPFVEFTAPDQALPHPKKNELVEILHEDESKQLLVSDQGVKELTYSIDKTARGYEIRIPQTFPTARLWIKPKNANGPLYKCPNWVMRDSLTLVCVTKDAEGMELVGDKYFSQYYTFE